MIDRTLEEKLEFYSMPEPNTGCWIWLGSTSRGYGMLKVGNQNLYAHRASYSLHCGAIPAGLTIDHLCRNTWCINPKHLDAVTHSVNVLRGTSPSAKNAHKTECKSGHALVDGNIYSEPLTSVRRCRICRKEKKIRW